MLALEGAKFIGGPSRRTSGRAGRQGRRVADRIFERLKDQPETVVAAPQSAAESHRAATRAQRREPCFVRIWVFCRRGLFVSSVSWIFQGVAGRFWLFWLSWLLPRRDNSNSFLREPGRIYRPPGLSVLRNDYCRSLRTDCGSELACANMAVPDWTKMLYLA